MTYIPKERRTQLDGYINALVYTAALTTPQVMQAGVITYILTRIIDEVYSHSNYAGFAEAIGVLECTKQEFYRRVVVLYEDEKWLENGDVYDL